jgi:hypothetical protein
LAFCLPKEDGEEQSGDLFLSFSPLTGKNILNQLDTILKSMLVVQYRKEWNSIFGVLMRSKD